MQVLQLCHSYDPPFLDCARQYASLFAGTRYKVTTVYLTGKPSREVELGSASDKVIFLEFESRQLRGLKLNVIRAVRRIVSRDDYAFCIAHRSKPTYAALLGSKLRVISVHHAFGDFSRPSRRLSVNLFRQRLLLLGVSNAVRDDIRACLPSWPPEHIESLYNHIDIAAVQAEQLPREAARIELGLPQTAWIVGNVGRLHPDKDQFTLIRGFAAALPKLPTGSLLVICGKGRLEAELKALTESLGITDQVMFLGQVPQARRYFKAFDVFALTSDREPFGMVLLEAMAAHLPIITSDCGGGAEVVANPNSFFAFGDVSKLAGRLVEFSEIPLAQIQFITNKQSERLLNLFSDQAAKKNFFAHPFLQKVLS